MLKQTKPATVNLAEASQVFGVSTATAYRAVRETGQIVAGVPAIIVGKSYRFSTSALEAVVGHELDFD